MRKVEGGGVWLDLSAIGAALAVLYGLTLSRDLGTIDSGELAAVAAGLGIAHPTGYPLYTLLGRVAVVLWPGPAVVAVNLLAAVAAVGGAVVAARLARAAFNLPRWAGWAAGLWLGTSAVAWHQATGNEVYGLHLALVALCLLFLLRLQSAGGGPRELLVLAWIGGLALAHHLSVVFLLPAIATGLVWRILRGPDDARGRPGLSTAVWVGAALVAVLAWSVVLYLPFRSARDPLLDWGDPTNWSRFWRHLLGAQYRVWLFESGDQWRRQLIGYAASLPSRLSWPVLALAVAGLPAAARRRPRRLLILLLAAASTSVWASSYDIHDIAPYYLPVDLVLVVLASAGAVSLVRMLRTAMPAAPPTLWGGVLALGLAALQVAPRFSEQDCRRDRLIRAHAEEVLRSLPPRSVLLSRHWDAFVSASIYLQDVEGLRPDVTVVDPELLRRSWYYPQLRRWDPDLLVPLESEVQRFLEQVAPFEDGRSYDPAVIERAYREVVAGIATRHRPGRPTAFTPEWGADFTAPAAPVPEGLVFVLRDDPADSGPLKPPDPGVLVRAGVRRDDRIHQQVVESWTQMIVSRIRFLQAMGRVDEIAPWEGALEQVRSLSAAGAGPARKGGSARPGATR